MSSTKAVEINIQAVSEPFTKHLQQMGGHHAHPGGLVSKAHAEARWTARLLRMTVRGVVSRGTVAVGFLHRGGGEDPRLQECRNRARTPGSFRCAQSDCGIEPDSALTWSS